MPENRRLESTFLIAATVTLAVMAVVHWAVYVLEHPSWRTSWPAIPLTLAAIATGIGAYRMRRNVDKVRLMR